MAFQIMSAAAAAAQLYPGDFVYLTGGQGTFPPGELVPLAPLRRVIEEPPLAILLDMDGTLTSTEPLFLIALERTFSAMAQDGWQGLDPEVDYPALIGLSTAENIRYLSERYGHQISVENFEASLRRTCAVLAGHPSDSPLRRDAEQLLGHDLMQELLRDIANVDTTPLLAASENFRHSAVRLVFSHEYHKVLAQTAQRTDGGSARLEPLPAVGLLLAMLRGCLGSEAGLLAGSPGVAGGSDAAEVLSLIGACMMRWRPRLALVTSSARREVEIVLKEVFHHLREQVEQWPVSDAVRATTWQAFAEPARYFDVITTASETQEMRLKPHRDLYSLALGSLGLGPAEFSRVIGIEDTEAGVIALRAAGVSVACAMPQAESAGQGFRAASCVASGGVSELLIRYRLCLADNLLTSLP